MTKTNIEQLLLSKIVPDPNQPRKDFKKADLDDLQESIRKEGVLTPVIVESDYQEDKYLLIDGERRYRAAVELGLTTLPVKIVKGPLTFEQRTTLRFHIQEQHSSWTELERARALYEYKKATKKSITEIAEALNMHIPKVHGYLSIVDFSDVGQRLITENNIDFTYLIFLIRAVRHYQTICKLTQEEIEEKLIKKIITGVFKVVGEIQKFSRLMGLIGNEKEKMEFLNTEDVPLESFLNKIDDEKLRRLEMFYKSLEDINQKILKSIEDEYDYQERHLNILQEIKDNVFKILQK